MIKFPAEMILAGAGDYALALKGNQKTLHRDVVAAFANLDPNAISPKDGCFTGDDGHGPSELRQYGLINDVAKLQEAHKWPGLQSIGMVRSFSSSDKATVERRFHLNSNTDDAERFATAVRGHWSIECLHWQLDVSMFNEDQSRVRKNHAPPNLATLRRLAVSLLSKDTEKLSAPKKVLRCMLNHEHIAKVLTL